MTNFKKFTIFSVLSIVGIFSYSNAHAAPIEQLIDTTQQPFIAGSSIRQNLGNSLNGILITSGNISINATSTNQKLVITLSQCSIQFGALGTCAGSESTITTGSLTVQNNFTGIFNFTFTTSTTTISGRFYQLVVAIDNSLGGIVPSANGSTNENSYTNGKCIIEGTGDCVHTKDIYFQLGSALVDNTIVITIPPDGSLIQNPTHFGLIYNKTATTTEKIARVQVSIATTTANLFQSNFTPFIDTMNGEFCFSPCTLTASTTIQNINPTLPIGDYKIQGRIILQNNDLSLYQVIATSTIKSFSINDPQNEFYDPLTGLYLGGTTATTTGDIFSQCNQLAVGLWQGFVCNLFTFLFQPHDAVLNNLKNILTQYTGVFPFNAVFSLQQDTITFLESGTSTAPYTFSFKTPTGITNVNLLTATLLTDNNLTDFRSTYFQIIEALIWIGLGLMIYRKIVT